MPLPSDIAKSNNSSADEIKPSLKFLFVSLESLSGDIAWQLVKQGHQVKCYIKEKKDLDVYNGFLEKVEKWEEWVDWSDIIVFDDVEFGEAAEKLRKKGKYVIGGSAYTDKLEIDREFGQAELKKYGVNILPSWNFSDYDQAIEFIKNNPARYAFKPSGNTPSGGKGLLFLGEEEDGKDLLEILAQNKNVWKKKAPVFQLQKFVSGVEVAVGAFFNGHDFILPINVNFEHKRVFPGNIGPFSGEMGTLMFWSDPNPLFNATLGKMLPALQASGYIGYIDINCIVNGKGIYPLEWTCFSEDTEILTKSGWKFIKDVEVGEEVASLNPTSQYFEYQGVTGKIRKRFKGKLINIGGNGSAHEAINCLVTPDHQMYIMNRSGNFRFVSADKIPQGSKIKRTCNWDGEEQQTYEVPEYIELHYLGRYKKVLPITHSRVVMPMDVWLKFLGIFLAEGSLGGRKSFVSISQYSKKKEVKELLKNFPFKVTENSKGFQISSIQLVHHLLSYNFGKSDTKYIPEYVKLLSRKQISIFLEAFRIGDGNIHKRTKQKSYFSTSKRMIDDIQELLLKCGIVGNIRVVRLKGTKITGTKFIGSNYLRNHNLFYIAERKEKLDFYVDKRNIKKVDYNGYVNCVEVSNHIILVRREGKAFWCGNCRFGYPTIQIQTEGIITPIGEWLPKLARGENFELKTKKGFQVGVRILVATHFVRSTDKDTIEMYRDLPILFKKPNGMDGIHIEDVKKEEGVWRIAGESGVIMVVTGSGTTVGEARRQVYSRIQKIMVQNMFYRTDIGAKWNEDGDKLHTWGYLY